MQDHNIDKAANDNAKQSEKHDAFHSGFVTVIGRPNVGKSTLLNQIIGEKLSIISNKPQTTRNQIQIIYNDDDMQVVFLDTPGVQTPRNELGEYMLKISEKSLEDVDAVLLLVDVSEKIGKMDAWLLDELEKVTPPVILVINKIDTVDAAHVQELVDKFEAMDRFAKVIPISAIDGGHVADLKCALYDLLPEGPKYYPDDMITDRTERFVVSEIIREKALWNLHEEIPHGIFVGIEKMTEPEAGRDVEIDATIFVEKNSHKGMVIGKGGSMLKKIGTQARKEIEAFLSCHVRLNLWVKVEKDWRKKKNKLKEFGYE